MSVPSQPSPPDLEALLAHRDWVRKLAGHIANTDLADDTAQEAWVIALERAPSGIANPRGWLRSVMRNVNIGRHRSEQRRRRREERYQSIKGDAQAEEPAEVAERMDTFRFVAQAVTELNKPFSSTIFLHYFEGLSCNAISAKQGVPVATVHSRLRRGVLKLREKFQAAHPGDWRARCTALALPVKFSIPTYISGSLIMKPYLSLTACALALASAFYFWPSEDRSDGASLLPKETIGSTIEVNFDANAHGDSAMEPTRNQSDQSPAIREEDRPEFKLPDGVTRSASVRFQFFTEHGKPWPGVSFKLFGTPDYAFPKYHFQANEHGEAIVPCIPGEVDFQFRSYIHEGGNGHSFSNVVHLNHKEVIDIPLTHPGWKSYKGKVVDWNDQPLSGVKLDIGTNWSSSKIRCWVECETDEKGEFEFEGTKGLLQIETHFEGYPSIFLSRKSDHNEPLKSLKIQIPSFRTVDLTLADVDGNPIQDTWVLYTKVFKDLLISQNEGERIYYNRQAYGKTSSEGTVRINAAIDKEWPLTLQKDGKNFHDFTIPKEVTEFRYQIPIGNTLSGKVTDPNGNGISNARIFGWGKNRPKNPLGFPGDENIFPSDQLEDWSIASSDANGEFRLERLNEVTDGMVIVAAPGMRHQLVTGLSFPHDGPPLNIQMEPGLAIRGKLLGADGQPLVNRNVLLIEPGLGGIRRGETTLRELIDQNPYRTDERGQFEFHGLAPGLHELKALSYPQSTILAVKTIAAGDTQAVIKEGDGLDKFVNLSLSVFDSTTQLPIPNFRVHLHRNGYASSSGRDREVPLAAKVHHRSHGNPTEKSFIAIRAEGYRTWSKVLDGEPGFFHFDVELEPAVVANLKFVSPDGNPIGKLPVRVLDPDRRPFIGTYFQGPLSELAFGDTRCTVPLTMADGRFSFETLVPEKGGYFLIGGENKYATKLSKHSHPILELPISDPKPSAPETMEIVVPDEFIQKWRASQQESKL